MCVCEECIRSLGLLYITVSLSNILVCLGENCVRSLPLLCYLDLRILMLAWLDVVNTLSLVVL